MIARKTDPTADVSLWPLVIGVGLLAAGAVLSLRLGKGGPAVVMAVAAVALAGAAVLLRRPPAPRVRRVFVPDEGDSFSAVRLDTARYLSSAALPGLTGRSPDAAG